MTTRIEMIDQALLRIGANAIGSEAHPSAPVYLAVFDGVAEFMAGVHPWSFFRVTRQLARLDAAPAQHWRYAYQLPAERLGAIRAIYPSADTSRKPTVDYSISGDQVLTNHEALWVTFMATNTPTYWPGDFREGFRLLLMSELALSIREDRPLRDKLRQDALGTPQEQPHGGVIGNAISADSQAEPSTVVGAGDGNPLIDARW